MASSWPDPIRDDDIVPGLLGSFRLTWVQRDRVPRPAIVEVHENWRPATVVAVRRSLAGVDGLDVREEHNGVIFPVTPLVLPDQVSGRVWRGNVAIKRWTFAFPAEVTRAAASGVDLAARRFRRAP